MPSTRRKTLGLTLSRKCWKDLEQVILDSDIDDWGIELSKAAFIYAFKYRRCRTWGWSKYDANAQANADRMEFLYRVGEWDDRDDRDNDEGGCSDA